MIKPEELRIGNYVYTLINVGGVLVPCDVTAFRVSEITLQGINHITPISTEVYNFPFAKLSPIEITEDWLQRLGFEREETYFWKKAGVCFDSHFKEVSFFPNRQEFSALYVHQLQNFYYFCTGKQLTDINEAGKKITENDIRKKYQKSADYYKKRRGK